MELKNRKQETVEIPIIILRKLPFMLLNLLISTKRRRHNALLRDSDAIYTLDVAFWNTSVLVSKYVISAGKEKKLSICEAFSFTRITRNA
jgi:hypothetical protein